jgi:hypothetical protein
MNFQSLQIWKKGNRIFLKKMHRGPDLPRTGPIQRKPTQSVGGAREMADSNGLPAGPGGQRPRETESVRSEGGRPIKSGSMAGGAVLMWELLLLHSPVMVPENLLMFCWHVVDDVNDQPVANPKRRCDEHSSKFSLSYETKVYQSSRK